MFPCLCRAGRFDSMCNMESVSVGPLKKNIDVDFVRELLQEFQEKTGSQVALDILNNWDTEKDKFIKVRHFLLIYIYHSETEIDCQCSREQIETHKRF